jgi:thymidylate synthase (FAD)
MTIAKPIAVTRGVGELEEQSAEDIIAYVARVSNPDNQLNFDTASRLLRYCIKNRHWSIFETAYLTIEINTTRAIETQILRHRSFTFQSFSQRYADVSSIIEEIPVPELRRQDQKNRQNSTDDLDTLTREALNGETLQHFVASQDLYRHMLESGVAKECARNVLPLCTPTRLYMTGNVRSWLTYIDLRQSNGTQKEHRDVALACKEVFTEFFPDIAKAMWDTEEVHTDPRDAKIKELEAEIATLNAVLRTRNTL